MSNYFLRLDSLLNVNFPSYMYTRRHHNFNSQMGQIYSVSVIKDRVLFPVGAPHYNFKFCSNHVTIQDIYMTSDQKLFSDLVPKSHQLSRHPSKL